MFDDQNDPQNDDTAFDPSDDDAKHQQSKPPSVTGEEDISGDTPAESPDIDDELAKIGEKVDPEHPTPLGED